MLARLTFHLAGAESERTMGLAGAPVTVPLGKGSAGDQANNPEVEVVRPSGEVVRITKLDLVEGGFRYVDTHEAGVYLVRLINRKPPRQVAFAVNIDPAESDPATLTNPELLARFGTRPLIVCENPESCPRPSHRLREGTSLWEWFLAAVLIGLVLEVFLANRGASVALAQPQQAVTSSSQPVTMAEPTAAIPRDNLGGFLESLEQEAAKPDLRQ